MPSAPTPAGPPAPAGQPATAGPPTSTGPGRAGGRTVLVQILPTLILSVAAPIVLFNVMKAQGSSDVAAYLWASVGPILETLGTMAIKREIDRISLLIAGLTLGAAAVALIGRTSPVILLLKDSALTGLFGLICLGTLLGKPLMFLFARKFSRQGQSGEFDQLWDAYPMFRNGFRVITAVWGVGFLLEAAIKVVVAETVPFQEAFNVNQVLPLVVALLLAGFTFLYSRRMQARGRAAREAALAATVPPEHGAPARPHRT